MQAYIRYHQMIQEQYRFAWAIISQSKPNMQLFGQTAMAAPAW